MMPIIGTELLKPINIKINHRLLKCLEVEREDLITFFKDRVEFEWEKFV